MALTKLTTDLIDGSLGTDWQATPKTADFTAVAGEGYFVDTTSTAITVTLPSSPTAGNEVSIIDYGANASTNNITITSSDNIEGASGDLVLSTNKVSKTLVYSDATKGWLVANDGTGAPPVPITVDYLVVAGGGSGAGYVGGGGGAGGLRTSYANSSTLNGHNESALPLETSTNYALTVGAGAAGGGEFSQAPTGSNSTFQTITSNGGGGSGSGGAGNTSSPQNGGSGGGGGSTIANYAGGLAVTTPVTQGYRGANTTNSAGTPNYPSGGGGGASQVGSHPLSSSISSASQIKGGDGLEVNIIGGTGNYYAGGGGGSSLGYAGTGGTGGGGNGAIFNINGHSLQAGTNGSPNTGGGAGGGSASVGSTSGPNAINTSGGSGVVILRYPNTFTVTIGAGLTGTTATDGSDKVTTFTAGTGTISFS
jgi:hypothetical protein